MFLKRLVLENVRSIPSLDLTFLQPDGRPRQWTLVLGENGTGKSTILRSVALALAGSDALPVLMANSDDWIRRGANHAKIHLELLNAEGELREVNLDIRRGDQLRKIFADNREHLEQLDWALMRSPHNYFTAGYGVSRRLQSSHDFVSREAMSNPRAQRVATLFSPDAVLRSVEAWAMDLDYRRPEVAREVLSETFAGMLPGIEFAAIDKESRKLTFDTPDGTLPLDVLSDGYQNIISWCGDLLYRITEAFSHYRQPLHARGLLLIDEVDLHLHPLWQRRLVEFLQTKLPNFQILASTHSPLTAHQASEGEVYLLKRPEPTSPPELEAFAGSPRKLLLHQFLLSPAFGLNTADSRHLELLKEKTTARSPEELEELKAAPEWELNSSQSRARMELLREIRQELVNRK